MAVEECRKTAKEAIIKDLFMSSCGPTFRTWRDDTPALTAPLELVVEFVKNAKGSTGEITPISLKRPFEAKEKEGNKKPRIERIQGPPTQQPLPTMNKPTNLASSNQRAKPPRKEFVPKCFNCGERGHKVDDCPKEKDQKRIDQSIALVKKKKEEKKSQKATGGPSKSIFDLGAMEEIPPLDQNRILFNPEKLEKDLIFENGKLKTILTISQKRRKADAKAWIDTGAAVSLISKKLVNKIHLNPPFVMMFSLKELREHQKLIKLFKE